MLKFTLLFLVCVSTVSFADDWKGKSDDSQWSIGGLAAVGLGNQSGLGIIGTASKKIVQRGFADDLTNSVSIEGIFGPRFSNLATVLQYGVHLRWDFEKDNNWTLYALGGFGGTISTYTAAGTQVFFSPRFGVGAFWKASARIYGRAELTHDQIALGLVFPY